MKRQTLANSCRFDGIGIHSGLQTWLSIDPAPAGNGITFHMAGSDKPPLPAHARFAVAEQCDRRTVLRGPQGQHFEQVEHVLAALASCSVSDALVTFGGKEPPFMEGGAEAFCKGLKDSGRRHLEGTLEPLVIRAPFVFHDPEGDVTIVATPHDGVRLSCYVEFPGSVVGSMGATLELSPEEFLAQAAPARTFARKADLDALRAAGLARGGSMHVALVFDEHGYLNDADPATARRYPDEVARHKIIDLLGDLALLGRPLRGHFWAWRAGHKSHVRFAQCLLREAGN